MVAVLSEEWFPWCANSASTACRQPWHSPLQACSVQRLGPKHAHQQSPEAQKAGGASAHLA